VAIFGLKYDNIDRFLDSYAKYILRQASSRLDKQTATGHLKSSLDYTIYKTKQGYDIRFFSAEYGEYLDKGVSGTETRRSYIDVDGIRRKSPYKFTTKGPPVITLEQWIKNKGFGQVRGKGGKFISHKSLSFLISKSIKRKGRKSLSFLSLPISYSFKRFKEELVENFAKDLEVGLSIKI